MIMKCQKRLLNNSSTSSSIQMEWTSILYSILSFRQKKSDEMMKINYHQHFYIRQSDLNGHRQINWLFKSCEKQRKDSFKLIVTKLYMNAYLSLSFFLYAHSQPYTSQIVDGTNDINIYIIFIIICLFSIWSEYFTINKLLSWTNSILFNCLTFC